VLASNLNDNLQAAQREFNQRHALEAFGRTTLRVSMAEQQGVTTFVHLVVLWNLALTRANAPAIPTNSALRKLESHATFG
jgi:hypothetical protein